jgi:hypothetical protein
MYESKLKEARFNDATEGTADNDVRIQADDFLNSRL